MKPSLQHLAFNSQENSFYSYQIASRDFGFHWHYHPEYELTFIKKGSGTRLVGDNVSSFSDEDLVLLGPNIPHTWISESNINGSNELTEVIGIHFPQELFSMDFLSLPEMESISRLLKRSSQGIFFKGVQKNIAAEMEQLNDLRGFSKFNRLLHILNLLGECTEIQMLASTYYSPELNSKTENRLDRVFNYIHANYSKPVSLSEIADLVNMSNTSFCRFFRKNTGKSLIEYVNDLRIGKACNLLLEEQKTISEISFSCGFNSQTFFNRSFIQRKGLKPREFRKKYCT